MFPFDTYSALIQCLTFSCVLFHSEAVLSPLFLYMLISRTELTTHTDLAYLVSILFQRLHRTKKNEGSIIAIYIYSAQIYLYRRHVRPCIWYTPLQFSATTTLISPSRVFSQGFSIIINSLFSASVFSNKIICMHVCSEEEIGFTKWSRSLIIILVHDPACPAGIMGQINNGWNPYLHIGTVLVLL